jgi:2-iminobutanoate/2-iminopropanoate deaminase
MTDRAEIRTERAPQAIGPYSQGIRAGGFLFTSGQIPLRPSGDLVSGDIRAEARQALENVRAVLEAGGARMEDVVKTTVFLVDLADFSIVNEVYAGFFPSPPPARSCVQVAALPKGARVEVEAVAAVDPARSAR